MPIRVDIECDKCRDDLCDGDRVYCEKCYDLAKCDIPKDDLHEHDRDYKWAIEYIRKELGIKEVFFDNLIKRVVKIAKQAKIDKQ